MSGQDGVELGDDVASCAPGLGDAGRYGQWVFAAPAVFRFQSTETVEYDYEPAADARAQVEHAAAACPGGGVDRSVPDAGARSPPPGCASA
ncbi:hypothetical protein Val02_78400 [Virgisporangium aliadipatigenens]|uniref:Ferredoxin n=1 Tax=Virgisporangium aliadipatigenens TaxID=741659 RepID=A0A8J3YSM3_9ACTN|nr:hypothetical protein Val02_78400 [Virgisporangium aliadipatigenens]